MIPLIIRIYINTKSNTNGRLYYAIFINGDEYCSEYLIYSTKRGITIKKALEIKDSLDIILKLLNDHYNLNLSLNLNDYNYQIHRL